MRVGIVSKWIASGQAVVARQIRSALDGLGHDTFVLARPGSGPRAARAGAVDRTDPVWDQPGITEASAHEIPAEEYRRWVEANGVEAILCDENYQFEEIRSLREDGVLTIGRFVWEYFAPEHTEGALEAYETIYSLTRCERDRYAELGIESPYVQWGIHPELLAYARDRPDRATTGDARDPASPEGEARGDAVVSASPAPGSPPGTPGREAEEVPVYFFYPGSFLGRRKPTRKVVNAFTAAAGEGLRLVVSGQLERHDDFLRAAAERDPRIELALSDQPEAEHRALFASCDACLAPSRWEGLGLPLFEATAFGLPIITNDRPPMSEMVLDGESGILVPSERNGTARSGISAWDPDVGALTAAIERLGDRDELERMRDGVNRLREERAWERTVADLDQLLS